MVENFIDDMGFSAERVVYDSRQIKKSSELRRNSVYLEKNGNGNVLKKFSIEAINVDTNWMNIVLIAGEQRIRDKASMSDMGITKELCTGAYRTNRYVVPE